VKKPSNVHLSVVPSIPENDRPNHEAPSRPSSGPKLPKLVAAKAITGWSASRMVLAEPVPWRWGRIVADSHAVEVSGGVGDGKTTFASLLVASLAAPPAGSEPRMLLGHTVAPVAEGRSVLYVGEENGRQSSVAQIDRAIEVLGLPPEETWSRIVLLARAGVHAHYLGDEDTLWKDIVAGAQAGLWGAVFLDTRAKILSLFGASKDEESQAAASRMVTSLVEAGRCPVFVLSHLRKGADGTDLDGISGSAQRAGGADVALLVTAKRCKGRVLSSTVAVAKNRDDDGGDWPAPMAFSLAKADGAWTLTEGEADEDGGKLPPHERVHALLRENGEQTVGQIRKALGLNNTVAWGAIQVLRKEGRVSSRETLISGTKREVFKGREAFDFSMLAGGKKKQRKEPSDG